MRSMSSKAKMKGSFWKRCRLSHYALCYTVCIIVSAILVWANQRNTITFSNQWANKHYTGLKFFGLRIGQDPCKAVTDPLLDYFTMRDFLNLTEHITTYYPALPIKCPEINEPIDIVYTWVNGSDADFQNTIHQFKLNNGELGEGELVSRRFHGKMSTVG